MNLFLDKYFKLFFIFLSTFIFIIICLRAYFIPFNHDESATFFTYIQSDSYMPYTSHVYTNNHILNSGLSNICYHLFGSHRFYLRIPNILSFIIFCFGLFRFSNQLNKPSSKIILISFLMLCFNFLDFFEMCRGYGLSLAFLTLGLSYLSSYFEHKIIKQLCMFYFLLHIALIANLTLLVPLVLLISLVLIFQIRTKLFFNVFNFALLFCPKK